MTTDNFVAPAKWTPPYVTQKGFSACDYPTCFCPLEARCKVWYEPDTPARQHRPNGHNYMCRCQECTANETP